MTDEVFTPVTHSFSTGGEVTFTKPNQRLKKKIEVDPKNRGVKVFFLFADGTEQVCEVDNKHKNHWMFTGHGVSAKIGDAASGKNIKTVEDAKAEVARMIEQTKETWNTTRSSGSGGINLFVRAIARLKKIPEEEALEKVAAMSDEKLKHTRSLDIVKNQMDLIRLEDIQKKVEKQKEAQATADDVEL